jgi:hypothetical protein
MKSSLVLLVLIAAAPSVHAYDHAKLCADLAKSERNFCDQVAMLGLDNAFLANMADECFIPYNFGLTRADYEMQAKAAREKAGETGKGGPDPNVQLVWSPSKVDVSADGTLGYTWGHYTYSERAKDGKVATAEGIYLTIWKRKPGGVWQVVYDGSPELPGGPAALKKFLARPDLPKPPAG